jgi:hypothetical protein
MEKPPLEEAIIQQPDLQSSHQIQQSPRKILVLYTRLSYHPQKTLKDLQDYTTKALLNQEDPHRLLLILEYNYDRRPQILPEISRRV